MYSIFYLCIVQNQPNTQTFVYSIFVCVFGDVYAILYLVMCMQFCICVLCKITQHTNICLFDFRLCIWCCVFNFVFVYYAKSTRHTNVCVFDLCIWFCVCMFDSAYLVLCNQFCICVLSSKTQYTNICVFDFGLYISFCMFCILCVGPPYFCM